VAGAAARSHLALRRAVMEVAVSQAPAGVLSHIGPDTEAAVSLLVTLEEAAEAELRRRARPLSFALNIAHVGDGRAGAERHAGG
jgi:hypothetical protein